MASYRSPSSGTKRRGQGRGRMSVPAARKKTSTKRGRSAAEARKARLERNKRMRAQGSSTRTRTTGQERKTPSKAAKKVAKGPKKDTRTRGGQSGPRGAVDQMAFQRFVNMTPAQQRHVMRMAPGEQRRKTR